MKRKIIRNYAIFVALEALSISFFFATYQLFLTEKGLSLLEINLLNCGFMLSTFLFEIPTGAIADFFGRKRSAIIGLALFAFSFLIYFVSGNFWEFLLAEVISALAGTCLSGATEALVFDSLKNKNVENFDQELFRKAEIKTIGTIVGVALGSYVGHFNLALPWLLSAISFALLSLIAFFLLPDDEREKGEKVAASKLRFDFTPLRKIASESISYGLRNKSLMPVVWFSAILSFVLMPLNMYWPIILNREFLVPTEFMGLVFVGISLSIYGGSQLSTRWQKRIVCTKNAIFFSQIITVIGILGCVLVSGLPIFLLFFMLHESGRGLLNPLYRAYINNSIESRNRATVLSFESMISKAAAGLGLIVSGVLANNFGILFSWFVAAMILLFGVVWFYFKNKRQF